MRLAKVRVWRVVATCALVFVPTFAWFAWRVGGTAPDVALARGVMSGDLARVEAALRRGASPNVMGQADYHGAPWQRLWNGIAGRRAAEPALVVAFARGNAPIARALLARGASMNVLSRDGHTPEFVAAEGGSLECMTLALAHGASANEVYPDAVDARVGVSRRTKATGPNPQRTTLLEFTALNGESAMVELLLKRGARPDLDGVHGVRALCLAVCQPHASRMARAMLDAGADPNYPTADGPPLVLAARTDAQSTLLLLGRGAKADLPDQWGLRALAMAAASFDDPSLTKALIRAGADLHRKDPRGRTALHYAAVANHPRVCELLLTRGADPFAADSQGWRPIDAAANPAAGGVQSVMAAWLQAHPKAAEGKAPPNRLADVGARRKGAQ